MKILITGVSLRSRGGEAMVFEICKKIKELDSSCQIFLLSDNCNYDTNFLKKLGNPYEIKIYGVPRRGRIAKLLNIDTFYDFFAVMLFQIFRLLKLNIKMPYRTSLLRSLADSDIILEIAGISFTESFGLFHAINSTARMTCARLLGKKYICLPQSYGPSNNILINLFAKIGLNTVAWIMPRGRASIKFLMKIGVRNDNIIFVPDLAFSYENPSEAYKLKVYKHLGISTSEKYVGILPNIHIYRWFGNKFVDILTNVIDNLVTQFNYHILLIPHEVCGDLKILDDAFLCNLLYKRVKNKEKVLIFSGELTANEIKSLIALCDFTITSRYHAMISSLKMCVPPIVIAWADKYHEAMELFNLTYFVINYKDLKEEVLMNKIALLLHERNNIVNKIKNKLIKYEKASDIVKCILKREMYVQR